MPPSPLYSLLRTLGPPFPNTTPAFWAGIAFGLAAALGIAAGGGGVAYACAFASAAWFGVDGL